jgi:hypothetical protein
MVDQRVKVAADISTGVQFDVLRNQIARTIDVMLEPNAHLQPPLSERHPIVSRQGQAVPQSPSQSRK